MNNSSNGYQDDTFENSQSRQRKFSNYFKNEVNSKLKNMNICEDSSNWSESMKKSLYTQSHKQVNKQQYDLQDLLHSCGIQNDQHSIKDFFQKSDKQYNLNETNQCIKPLFEINELNQNGQFQEDSNIFSINSAIGRDSMAIKVKRVISTEQGQDFKQDMNLLNKKCSSTTKNLKNNEKFLFPLKYSIQILLKLRFFVMKFYRQYTIYGRTKQLNQSTRTIINDQSDVISLQEGYSSFQVSKYCRQLYCKQLIDSQIPLINPQSMLGFFVKLVITLANFIIMFQFSIILTFLQQNYNHQSFSKLVSVFWLIEIIIQINTAPFYFQLHKSDRKSIIIQYIKQNLLFDSIPLLFLHINSSNIIVSIISNLLVFLKIVNLIKDLNFIQKRICMMVKRYYIIQAINLIIELFLVGHFIACIWYLIGVIEINYLKKDHTWFDITDDKNNWFHLYIWALYWALTLMTTGSNTAETILQASFTTFTLLFTTICFGYFLNAIGVILQEIDERLLQKRKDINIINDYMREKNISKSLQSKVNIDLDYYYYNDFKKQFEDNMQVLDKISVDLKNSLLKEYNKQIISKIPVLQNNFSTEILEELSLYMNEEYYFPNQMVQREAYQSQSDIIYIVSGQNQNKRQMKQILKQKDVFGESHFITGQTNSICLKSIGFSKIVRIGRNSFKNLIKDKQKDFEIFCQIRDRILLYQDYSDIDKICSVCNLKSHPSLNCSQVNLNKQQLIQKEVFLQRCIQKRAEFLRKLRKQFRSILQANELQDKLKEIQDIFKQNYQKQTQSAEFTLSSFQDIEGEEPFTQLQIVEQKEEYQNKSPEEQMIQEILSPEISIVTKNQNLSSLNEFEEIGKEGIKQNKDQGEINGSIKLQSDLKKRYLLDNLKQSLRDSQGMIELRQFDTFETENCSPSIKIKKNNRRKSILKAFSKHQLSLPEQTEQKQETRKYQRSGFKQRNSIIQQTQLTKESLKKIDSLQNFIEENYQNFNVFNPWEFETQKDYKHYFVTGNSKYIIQRMQRYQKKNKKSQRKTIKK